MSKPSRRRERYLRKQRERLLRSRGPADADMRFRCSTCGTTIVRRGNVAIGDVQLINMDTGAVRHVAMDGVWTTQCPTCGREAKAVNQVSIRQGDHVTVGFADTPHHLQKLVSLVSDLQQLEPDASIAQILDAIEAQGPELQPVADYVRRHHLELAALGVGLLGVVIALLTWLLPVSEDDEQPPPPTGITHDQMERLLADLEKEAAGQQQDQARKGDDAAGEREHRRPSGQGGADR